MKNEIASSRAPAKSVSRGAVMPACAAGAPASVAISSVRFDLTWAKISGNEAELQEPKRPPVSLATGTR